MIFISFTLILPLVSWINAEECQKKDACECAYSNGTGFSLKDLIQSPNSFINGYADNNAQIYFSPCTDSKSLPNFPANVANECEKGYTLCFYNPGENRTFVLGTVKDTYITETQGQIYMNFGTSNISTIQLQCTSNLKTSILYAPLGTKLDNINLTLFSRSACLTQVEEIKSPGFFSTFFLIFFIVLFTYLVIGIVYNYFFVGARGFELIPNYDFWCRVWTSLKLGFYYVKNGCRIVPTEDSYDAI